jgi:hypothetical protein
MAKYNSYTIRNLKYFSKYNQLDLELHIDNGTLDR